MMPFAFPASYLGGGKVGGFKQRLNKKIQGGEFARKVWEVIANSLLRGYLPGMAQRGS